jgi:hypothetical protein
MLAAAAAVAPLHPVALRLPPGVTSITRLQAAARLPCRAREAWNIASWLAVAVAVRFSVAVVVLVEC